MKSLIYLFVTTALFADMIDYYTMAILPGLSTPKTILSPSFGIDTSQCPATLADRGANVVHFCDCQNGADITCNAGDDANTGKASSPKQSIAAAISEIFAGNDVALCRGGVWDISATLQPSLSHCSASNPCTIQDYGNGDLAKPLIRQMSPAEGIFTLDPGDYTTVWAGLEIQNIHLQKPAYNSNSTGIFVFRDVSAVQIQCTEIEGFGIGMYVNADHVNPSGHWLKNSYIHDNGVFGWLGGADETIIENNWFDNNGYANASMFQHNMYISGDTKGMVVRGNKLTRSAVDANGQCLGVSLNVHSGSMTDLLIEHNLIEELNPGGGCWGLMVDGVGNAERHTNVVIRGNVLRDVGYSAIGVSSCIDCIIENNLVIQTKLGGATGILSPNRPTSAPDADVTGTIVRNNTVYYAENGSGIGYYIGERGSNYKVSNNIAYFAQNSSGNSCYHYDLPASSYDLISHNLCYGATFYTGATGMDARPFTFDPKFVDAPNSFALQSDSPAINAGTPLSSSTQDLEGKTRDAQPDLGAYEH